METKAVKVTPKRLITIDMDINRYFGIKEEIKRLNRELIEIKYEIMEKALSDGRLDLLQLNETALRREK